MNKAMLVGRLGKNPEVIETDKGMLIGNFSVATSEYYNGKEQTEWHNIVCFEKTAEFVEKYFKKGDPIEVEGTIRTKKWEDREGNTKYRTEIIAMKVAFVPGAPSEDDDDRPRSRSRSRDRDDDDRSSRKSRSSSSSRSRKASREPDPQPDFEDDEIPF